MTPKACEHIMDSGRNCASPRLNGGRFCYWHNRLHTQHHFPGSSNYESPILDSANAVALALNHIYRGQSRGLIDGKAARPLQQSLRLALQAFRLLDRPLPDKMVTDLPGRTEGLSGASTPTSLCGADTLVREPVPCSAGDPHSAASPHIADLCSAGDSPAVARATSPASTPTTAAAPSPFHRLTPEQERNIANLVRRSAG